MGGVICQRVCPGTCSDLNASSFGCHYWYVVAVVELLGLVDPHAKGNHDGDQKPEPRPQLLY
jgi:hypothetical protein